MSRDFLQDKSRLIILVFYNNQTRNASQLCLSSLHRVYANLLYIAAISVEVPPKRVHSIPAPASS